MLAGSNLVNSVKAPSSELTELDSKSVNSVKAPSPELTELDLASRIRCRNSVSQKQNIYFLV